MKNTIIKSLLALIMGFMVLPMMGQDFMNIYFKNGDFRKFYLENVMEITTSKFDANGVQHSDINYQHITTIYDRYIYSLEDVDSITFSKVDEEKAEQNFISAMPNIFSAIEECETIEDVNGKIDQIKTIEGVEDVWIDSHKLYISIKEGEVFSFHFGHDADLSAEAAQNFANQVKASAPKLAKIIKPDGTPLKFVIANQRHNDESKKQEDCREKYNLLIKHLKEFGIDARYEDNPNVNFFYANSKDPEHLNLYDYDVVLLSTHGSYGYIKIKNTILLGAQESSQKFHSFISSEDIIKVPKQPYSDWWEHYYKLFKDWRKNNVPYQDITNEHINFSFHSEIRDGKMMWVAHPELTEYFFKDIASGKFDNPNSIFLNCACESLKGDNGPSHSLAEILFNKGLGVYAGYTRAAYYGPFTYTFILHNMLRGASLGKSHELLPEYCKDESKAKDTDNAILEVFDSSGNMPSDFYLLPTTTVQLNEVLVNQEYLNNQFVTLHGFTTLSDYHPGWDGFVPSEIELGFELGSTPDLDRTFSYNSSVEKHFVNNELGNCEFELPISNLKQGQTYYYRSYTYDGLNNNYGDCYSFTLYNPPILSENTISLLVGNTGNIRISSGSGEYEAISNNPEVATASVSKLHENYAILLINTLKPDTATIIVKDIKSGHTVEIAVTVLDHLSFSISGNINLKVGETSTIDITSGSGTYSIEKIEPTGVVTASISENHISIEALTAGSAIITVKDDKSGEMAPIEVKVEWDHLSLAVDGTIDLKVGENSTVDITTGSGSYSILKIEPEGVVTASISENHISIEALTAGTATITVKDDKSGEKESIEVTVTENELSIETETFTVNGVSFTMIAVEGGTFMMGGDAYMDERPIHEVKLNSFSIGQTEVTQELWLAIMGSNPSNFKGSNRPVEEVSWNDCQTFISKLNTLTGRNFRLPTEAEWEYAARGGKKTEGYVYAGSDNVDDVAWYQSNSDNESHPVAQKQANELGLYDMSGNVDEWCEDWFDASYYDNSPSDNPCNTNPSSLRVFRGGRWSDYARFCRVQNRNHWYPDSHDSDIGFRLALSAGETTPQSYITCPDDHHPHMIDLGLPSGTKWACCNVGADTPEGFGDYFAWGETEEKSEYSRETYRYCNFTNRRWHWENLGSDIAGTDYDAATANWGAPWRMPTLEQIDELLNDCTVEKTTQNEVNGLKFVGPSGRSIFLPDAGYKLDEDLSWHRAESGIWSSTYSGRADEFATFLGFESARYYDSRCKGRSVRPVQ